jgi:hypothetical protein
MTAATATVINLPGPRPSFGDMLKATAAAPKPKTSMEEAKGLIEAEGGRKKATNKKGDL